ncbi:outer membrane protein assembly factor BamB family protein [Streptomyces sp. HD]|uniref:outer membrane protein assembly factor BamB family protein n=1 Tax=Streptomyces sp. HD TaxID=3020892 RepID=UPI0023301286|nr:PQQ-binding-like beta-propeller repeat protein [Streptomyces sp. HD]MDC0767843.1 PQQ-binding-like beta-propeller repeat protein [Streptomyces sp. HD]
MTQPPPPPHQPPPGGGFGPPQDQPPQQQPGGGFGPPQPQQPPAQPPGQPPQPPAYGYPQAPQGAPQTPPPTPPASPGYGYPGPQPGAYGQPQNPYGQPGYGYPQQTVPLHAQSGGPGGGGGGGKSYTWLVVVAAAVVAIALVIGGVVIARSGDDGGKDDTAGSSGGTGGGGDDSGGGSTTPGKEKVPADPNSRVLFQVPAPKVADDTTISVSGSWLTDKAYVKSGVSEIVGYDPDKGTELWTIPLPGPVCRAAKHVTEDNLTAVAFEPAKPTKAKPSHGCTQVAAIDLDAGKKLWTKSAEVDGRLIPYDNITLSGGTVAAGGTSGGAAFDLESGKPLWVPKANDSCYDLGYAGGPKMVAVRKCGSYDQPQLNIQTIDPKTGKVISEYKMAEGVEYASVISTEPLVVAAEAGQSDSIGISDVFSIDNKTGKLRIRISVPGDQYAARCSGVTTIEACTGVVVGNDRLYVETEEHQGGGEYGRTNEIVAFDLATGKQTGQRADAGDRYTITPLRMDGGNVIAYKRPPYNKGGQIVSIDGGSFKETKLLENPAAKTVRDVETRMLPEYAELLYSQGRLYMSARYASELGTTYQKKYHVIAFGRTD